MYEFYPYFTNDGSVGLYSEKDNDIYHSTYGALSEAYEKFIQPADFEKFFQNNSEIKILDICFGIGYNSKSFINNFIKNLYNATIDTNNISTVSCNDEIYTDNTFCRNPQLNLKDYKNLENFKIYIKAIDTDKILAFLSPFIICNKKKLPKNYKLPFKNEKIEKMLNKSPEKIYEFFEGVNLIFLEKICEKNPDIFKNEEIERILCDKKYREYFDPSICRLFKLDKFSRCSYTLLKGFSTFLHNIYYLNISKRYKKPFKRFKYSNFIFDLKINDARKELLDDNNVYNFMFLDAFTPAKCPALWTVDFFKLLFKHLNENGMVLTYSNSAAIRNAFLNAGFFVGKIYNPQMKKYTGTIAVKNKSLIKHELSEYDLGLLKTRAGIFYRDENLTDLNEAIIERHKKEVDESDLISSSKYIKSFKNNFVL